MKRKSVTWVGLAILVMALIGLGTGLVMAQSPNGETIKAPTIVENAHIEQVPELARTVPELTDAQESDVERALGNSVLLANVVGPRETYTTGRIGPWVSAERELIGAIVELHLDSPATYEGVLPLVNFEPDSVSEDRYSTEEVAIQAHGIEGFYVLIDLDSNTVVGIEIAEATTVVFPNRDTPEENRNTPEEN